MTDAIGRNDPCPCGSGKKYKKCCMGKPSASRVFTTQTTKPSGHNLNATNVAPPSELLMRAVALHQAGRLDEAGAIYQELLRRNPEDSHALHYLGLIALQQGRYPDAVNLIERAINSDRLVPAFYCNLGNAYKAMGQIDSAIAAYLEAVRLDPGFQAAHNNLGNMYLEQGNLAAAVSSYRQALALQPDFAEVRWQLAMSKLQLVAESENELEAGRAEFLDELANLNAWFDTRMALGYRAVGVYQPFFLAYQEVNNHDLLSRYGTLCARLMKFWLDDQGLPPVVAPHNPVVRVGVVSAHIKNHSVWNAIVKGWFQHLDRSRIELHLFHTGLKEDEETEWARQQAKSFEGGSKSLRQWVDAITAKQLDVLIYPEIGMDQMTVKLASMRLVPVQIASWGHPETTGLPTMDYYLSAEDIEPPAAQDGYVEQLILLPHLGVCYHPMQVAGIEPDFAKLGIDAERPVLICPGAPFKYVPQHDHVLVEIARKLGSCQFVFFTHQLHGLSEKLHRRLERVFSEAGLNFGDYGVFIPWQPRDAFYGLMRRANVFLDTMGFSGFNTAMQAVECGLPVVAREGRFMRGRLASGILRRMGMAELIVDTEDEYVDLAVRLVQDEEYRREIRQCIETNRAVLFDDVAPVRALEDFLVKVAVQNEFEREDTE
jgi:predicted O-linked N-acetylglucosamine transferase (SPINDLY family)